LLERAGQDWTLVTPAFPETGRTVYKGNLFVNDEPLNESPLRNHPLNPMHDANLARVLAWQSSRPVRILDFQTVTAGADAGGSVSASSSHPPSIIAARINACLRESLGRFAFGTGVSPGDYGLGCGLARATLEAGAAQRGSSGRFEPVGGRSAAIAG